MTIDEQQIEDLRNISQAVKYAKDIYDDARSQRERMMRKAAMNGASYREIAAATGLAYQRVAQIIGDKPDERPDIRDTVNVPCPKCGAAAGEQCGGRTFASFHAERHDAFRKAMNLDD